MNVAYITPVTTPITNNGIGDIRPDQKRHEQMFGRADSHLTYERLDLYKLLSLINDWLNDIKRFKDGLKVPEGFVYASDKDVEWLTDADRQALTAFNREDIGRINA